MRPRIMSELSGDLVTFLRIPVTPSERDIIMSHNLLMFLGLVFLREMSLNTGFQKSRLHSGLRDPHLFEPPRLLVSCVLW